MVSYTCSCGEVLTFADERAGNPARCSACQAPFMVPSIDHSQPEEEEENPDVEPPEHDAMDVLAQFVLVLLYGGIPGLVGGYLTGGLCVGAAILINILHNISPVFVFVMPLFILAFLAFAPAVYGIGVGTGVGHTALLLRYRRGGPTALIALLWAATGLGLVPYIAEWQTPAGTEFFADILMPFIGLMVGASVNFEWLAEPKPVDVAPWIVQTVLGVSAVFGLLIAAGHAGDLAADEPDEEPQQPPAGRETVRAVLPGM